MNLDLRPYSSDSLGPQPDEKILKDAETAPVEITFNQSDVEALASMGFGENRCKRALLNTNHAGAEVAAEWLFAHMDDAGLDDPVVATGKQNSEIPAEKISALMDMGFSQAQAKQALKKNVNRFKSILERR